MAAAMLGTVDKPPMWASFGLRPVVGTPSTSGCYLPCFRKGRNCSCSRVGNIGMQPVSRTLPCPNGLLELMWNMDPMGLAPPPFWCRTSTVQRQRISIKRPTYIPWKTWRSKASTPRSSASWRSESSPMSIPWKPSLQSIFSRLQGTCRTSSPLTSGLRRLSGMVTPRLLPLSKLRLNGLMPKLYSLPWWTWWLK